MPYCSFLRSSSNPALIPSRFGSGSSQASQNSGDICRICHCESDPQNPLLTPCYCSGSLKYVHQACLQQWLTASETNSCELCKFPFIMHTKIKPFNEVGSSHMWNFLIECQLIYFTLSLHCLASESIGLDWTGLGWVGNCSGAALTSPALKGGGCAAPCCSIAPQPCASSGPCVCSSSGPPTMSSVA